MWGLSSWWRKPALKIQDPQNGSGGRSDTYAGRAVGPDGAMQLAAFWSCVRLISETVATLPLGVYERSADGSKKPTPDHDLYSLLHDSPNADQTAAEYWEGQIASLCIFGNGYSKKEKRDNGTIVALTPLPADPACMNVRRTERGDLRYRFVYRGARYDLSEDDIFHIRGFGTGGDVGLSPVAYARQTLALADAMDASAGSTFKNGMKSSVFFTGPAGIKLSSETRADFKKTFIDPFTGADATAAAGLLEYGFDVKPVSISPADAELLLSRKFSTEEICRWLRVPPVLVGHAGEGQTMWGSGIEQIMLGWLTLGLRPYLSRVEQAIKKRLVPAAQRSKVFAEFNVEGLLRADSAGRAALLSSLGQNGYLTRNEGRALDNRPPMPGGDVLTVQSNLVPLDMLGKLPPKAVQPAPGDPIT
jgi:HK97 family phage portal protein